VACAGPYGSGERLILASGHSEARSSRIPAARVSLRQDTRHAGDVNQPGNVCDAGSRYSREASTAKNVPNAPPVLVRR